MIDWPTYKPNGYIAGSAHGNINELSSRSNDIPRGYYQDCKLQTLHIERILLVALCNHPAKPRDRKRTVAGWISFRTTLFLSRRAHFTRSGPQSSGTYRRRARCVSYIAIFIKT